ncbi:alpha-1-antitrypsin-like protein CM55-MS [Nothobranchius furzeri]|uniref:Thyroxine-binding globulin n=1 Tax=Nothobranchius furzeri TaxID=105023 RepID=A0A1A8VDS0_NOTFU|nr:alpha-1-antitrypsin-like protein CM55-MS [Nothobranchius furzeri]KAF7199209.1 alpha-1-antitrypsin-like protein CM55-MS [Nothobranchius furzeri]
MCAALVLWILSAVVCVGGGHHHLGYAKENQETAVDSWDNRNSLVTSASTEFAYRLYRKLAGLTESQGKNVFFSPFSVSVALAALSVGARGETHRQLFSGLGFNSSQLAQTDVDQAFRILLASMQSHKDISAGTAVFVDSFFKPQPEFLDVLKQSYYAEGFNLNFTKTTESSNTINKYVSGKTNGKIDKLVESLDPDTVMYLISYIYYKGKWATPFDPRLTGPEDFNIDEKNKVVVQMMKIEEGNFETYHDQILNTTVLHLPFNNSYSMLLLLPNNMETLEKAISPAHVTKWLTWKKPSEYTIYVPKFSIKTSHELNGVLTEMGIADMFGNRANFSGISEKQNLVVSAVVHKASLDVDEVGATAAAATGIGFIPLSYHFVPELKFNRPFMVIVTERNTKHTLFMGKIVNPNI